jgi:hypothetical protein
VTSSIRTTFVSRIALCLIFVQLLAFNVSSAQTIVPAQTEQAAAGKSIVLTSGEELSKMLDLSTRIMLHKTFYSLINETFAPLINSEQLPVAKSQNIVAAPTDIVSQSKITLLLYYAKNHINEIEDYLKTVPSDQVDNPNLTEDREKFRKIFEDFASNPKMIRKIRNHGDAGRPLVIVDRQSRVGYKKINFFVNHPRKIDLKKGNVKSNLIPADDLKLAFLNIINSAQSGDQLSYNFYDFDLMEIAEALIKAGQRGVKVIGGLDSGVIVEKEQTRLVYERLKQFESPQFVIEAIDSVGLNHQKIISLIATDAERSRTLLSSGNPTQSCIGKEGDLKNFPEALRPPQSIPNPNHLIVIEGDLPARIAAADVNKTVVYKLRGQSGYPVGGAYQVAGQWDKLANFREYIIMAFSPNGGRGDINRDIYTDFINFSKGPLIGGFFSFSSPELSDHYLKKMIADIRKQKAVGKPITQFSPFIGDAQFAMRSFSVLLRLSGKRLVEFDPNDPFKPTQPQEPVAPEAFKPEAKSTTDTVKIYIDSPNDPLIDELKSLLTANEWKEWQDSIRITPQWFAEKHFKLDGVGYKNLVKFHHKVIIDLITSISNAGSSINFSNAGEANQEQITIIRSREVSAVGWLYPVLA